MSVLLDIASGFQGTEKTLPITSGGVFQLCQANPLRCALIFSNAGPGITNISTDPNVSGSEGLTFVSGQILHLKIQDWGPFVQGAWFTLSSSLPSQVTVFEVVKLKE